MKVRKWLCLTLSLLLVISIPVAVSAHPGKTDGQGGHYDRSTGEYHFHHGYPAHDHYDMDGDGIPDCPYDFDDKTNHNSGSSSGSSSGGSYGGQVIYEKRSVTEATQREKTEDKSGELENNIVSKKEKVKKVPVWIVISLSVVLIILLIYIKWLRNKIKDNLKSYEKEKDLFIKEKDTNEAKIHDKLNSLIDDMEKTYGKDIIKRISGMPEGEDLDKNILPVYVDDTNHKWGSKYTFYLGSPYKYHRSGCRYSYIVDPINAYTINKNHGYSSCQVCHPVTPNTEWVDKYREYRQFLQEHGVQMPGEEN